MPDEFDEFADAHLPAYVGLPSFHKLPWCPDDASLEASRAQGAIGGPPSYSKSLG